MSSTNYEENGYALDLNLVIIFDQSHVWYYKRSGLMKQLLKTCILSAFKSNGWAMKPKPITLGVADGVNFHDTFHEGGWKCRELFCSMKTYHFSQSDPSSRVKDPNITKWDLIEMKLRTSLSMTYFYDPPPMVGIMNQNLSKWYQPQYDTCNIEGTTNPLKWKKHEGHVRMSWNPSEWYYVVR